MPNVNNQINEDEIIVFKLDKKKWLIPIMSVFCPLFLLIALIFLIPCFNNLFLGSVSFDSYASYICSIISLIFFIPLAIYLPISYFGNQLVITDKRLIMRKGLQGVLYIINLSDISAYQHISQTSRGSTSNFICIYLTSGKRIKSGNLYIKNDNLSDLINILSRKIDHIITSRKQYKELKQHFYANCSIDIKKVVLLPIVILAPFILAFLMLILSVGGVNEAWSQIDIQVIGTVDKKSISYDKHNDITGYNIEVIDEETNKKYEIDVNEEIYSMFEEKDRILIKAKKGTLGIVYDQWYCTQ